MKKLLALILLVVSVTVLVACGSNINLDGNWYEYDSVDKSIGESVDIVIEGNIGTQYSSSTTTFTIDKSKKEFSANGFVYPYVYENGKLSFNGVLFVREGSEEYQDAYAKLVKKQQEEAEILVKEESQLEKIETLIDELDVKWKEANQKAMSDFFEKYSGKYLLKSSNEERVITFTVDGIKIFDEKRNKELVSEWGIVTDSIDFLRYSGNDVVGLQDVMDIRNEIDSENYEEAISMLEKLIDEVSLVDGFETYQYFYYEDSLILTVDGLSFPVIFYVQDDVLKTNLVVKYASGNEVNVGYSTILEQWIALEKQ